ncbi:transcription factor HES-3-like [Amia ocellicauda]|uniref:transcription factor HES-3-like n=1 Tax=Amia ocellicauda TaxID=2972642 RepID=UPI003464A4F1
MVAASESPEKIHLLNGKKVSKPLMEKKRRARINECLEQLKALLENYYTNNIRKRKLEKADILELTVKHLRNLQKYPQGASVKTIQFAEYQAGFKNCLNGVNHYLMTHKSNRRISSSLLRHFSSNSRAAAGSSTADSDPGAAQTRECPPLCFSPNPAPNSSIPACGALTAGAQPGQHHRPARPAGHVKCQLFLKDKCPGNEAQSHQNSATASAHFCVASRSYWRPW